eukprot:130991-Pleurochrysis_carterae.AAC.3
MITELYRAAVVPDLERTVSVSMHDRSTALSLSTVESIADIRLCRNPANALYSAHPIFLLWRTLVDWMPLRIPD